VNQPPTPPPEPPDEVEDNRDAESDGSADKYPPLSSEEVSRLYAVETRTPVFPEPPDEAEEEKKKRGVFSMLRGRDKKKV
jgi:hypothetical protein